LIKRSQVDETELWHGKLKEKSSRVQILFMPSCISKKDVGHSIMFQL